MVIEQNLVERQNYERRGAGEDVPRRRAGFGKPARETFLLRLQRTTVHFGVRGQDSGICLL